MLIGFLQLCQNHFQKRLTSIIPGWVNSDLVENIFCQQRTLCNGANTNPTELQYSYAMNAVILGQSLIKRKSNSYGMAEPKELFAMSPTLSKKVKFV